MVIGFIFALLACLIWGLIFVVPGFISDYSTIEVALGRYFSYGVLSCLLLFRKGFTLFRKYPLSAWKKALTFGLSCNIIYYLGIVIGLRMATAPLTILIVGMAPIVISLYGNFLAKEVSYKSLLFPFSWIALGMVLVNAHEVDWTFSDSSLSQYLVGLLGILTALLSWSWFAVHNAQYLKQNPQIPSSEWATVIGVATFFWTLLLGTILAVFAKEYVDIKKFVHWTPDVLRYLMAIGVLGVVCSWIGCFLWNRASTYLPFSLMGPFLIFETIFGLIFVYLFEWRLPTLVELIGFSSMLTGILLSVLAFRKRQVVEH